MMENQSATLPPVVIAAAGGGKRLLPLTQDRPKCMLQVGTDPILIHQIRALQNAGVKQIQIITGHGEQTLRECCTRLNLNGLSYASNEHYQTTNSLFSLGCTTLDPSDAGLLIMNSDVVFHPLLLQRLLTDKRENVLLADFAGRMGEEEMKIRIDTDYRITAISKLIDPIDAQAENLGVLKVGPEAGRRILELARAPQEQNQLCWIPDAINHLLPEIDFYALSTGGLPWIEIDYLHDLQRAREHILPAIESFEIS